MYFLHQDKKSTFELISNGIKQVTSLFGKSASDGTIDGEKPLVKENAFYDEEVALANQTGRYVGDPNREKLYKEHMAKLEKGDPSVKIISGNIK